MFDLFRTPHPRRASAAMASALTAHGLPAGADAATLSVVQQRGSYAGRNVSYFRVFDPLRAAERHLEVHAYADLDAQPGLIVGSGHLERDGSIVLTHPAEAPPAAGDARVDADRAEHADDQRFIFPERPS